MKDLKKGDSRHLTWEGALPYIAFTALIVILVGTGVAIGNWLAPCFYIDFCSYFVER